MSAVRCTADEICSRRAFPVLPSRPGEFHPEPLSVLSHLALFLVAFITNIAGPDFQHTG